MLGTVDEPLEKAMPSGVLDNDIFDTEMADDSDSESMKTSKKIIKSLKKTNISVADVGLSSNGKTFDDSDSDDDDEVIGSFRRKSKSPQNKETNNVDSDGVIRRKTKHIMRLDSDDESDNEQTGKVDKNSENNSENGLNENKSDHESDDEQSNGDDQTDSLPKKKNRVIIPSDDDEDDEDTLPSEMRSRKLIIDSGDENEVRNDEEEEVNDEDHTMEDEEVVIRAKNKKKKSKEPKTLEPRRTKKAALEQIHSESQRLVRESSLNLPYHKPKPMTLDDFFKKKPVIKNLQLSKSLIKKVPQEIKKVDLTEDKEEKRIDNELVKTDKSTDDVGNETKNTSVNDEDSKQECENDKDKISQDSGVTSTPQSLTKPKEQNTGKLKLLKEVACLTPRLSGTCDDFIDLDDSGIDAKKSSSRHKGIEELMNRFSKHITKPKPVKKQQVQLSIVQKETTQAGKEELVSKSLNVVVEGEEQNDPKLNIPGAKLRLLKESLQAKMKVKREEERKKRQEAYQLDNEEGFGFDDDDEAEAELTDQTDTDDEGQDEEEDDMGIEGIEMEAAEVDGDSEEDMEDDDFSEDEMKGNMKDGKEEEQCTKTHNTSRESLSLKLVDSSTRSDPSNSSSSFKTPAKTSTSSSNSSVLKHVNQSIPAVHLSTETMSLFDSTSSLPDDIAELRRGAEKETAMDGFNCSAIKQKKGLIKHKSKDFSEYFLSDGFSESALMLESDKEEKDDKVDLKNVSMHSLDTSLEMDMPMGTVIPAYQPGGGTKHQEEKSVSGRQSPDLFTPWTKRTSTSSMPKSSSKLSDLTLPVEDSQDLFNSPPRSENSQQSSTQKLSASQSQNFHFSLDDETQSQFLDENGFLNIRSTTKPKMSKRQLRLSMGSDASQEAMDELLGLCSGKFTEDTQESERSTVKENFANKGKNLFSRFQSDQGSSSQRSNIDELLGLCSGTFIEGSQRKDKSDIEEDKGNDSDVSFHILSDIDDNDDDDDDDITKKREKKVARPMTFSDEEDDGDDDVDKEDVHEEDDDGMEGDLEDELDEEISVGLGQAKVKDRLSNFIEDEAELSGSDVGSEDEDDEDDEYEADAIDEELPSEELLKNQINRIHMKTVEDEDARRLRLYKEMYLQDGDLWSDGKGRMRRFRWSNMDDNTSEKDMFRADSDEEVSDNETEQELKWRRERYEREQWLEQQQKEKEGELLDINEDSQFTKIIRNIQKKEKGTPKELTQPAPQVKPTTKEKGVSTPKPLHKTMFRRGSFLCRSKEDLAKIAALTKPVANPNGPKNSRNFVFKSVTPPKENFNKKPQVRRSISVTGSSQNVPNSKRPRLDRSQSVTSNKSIFSLF